MKVVITIDLPEGSVVNTHAIAHPSAAIGTPEPEYVPPFADELIPLPDTVIPLPDDATPRQLMGQALNIPRGFEEGAALVRTMAQNAPAGCPVHRVPWKTVPAGVSKKTGRKYDAFLACPERGCDQRPAA